MDHERITRRRFNSEQRLRIAQRCENSGLSRGEFAQRHRIPLSSLQRWMRELQRAPKEAPAVVFHEVAISRPMGRSSTLVWAVEIVGPDGTTIRFRDGLPIEDIARLLRGRAC